MGTMINRRRVCGGKKGLLPSGYKQLEYIESTGTQYIDTGIKPDSDGKIRVKYIIQDISGTCIPFGFTSRADADDAFNGIYRVHGSVNRVAYGNGPYTTKNISLFNNANILYDVVCDAGVWTINGNNVATISSSSWQAEYNLWLFARNTGGNIGLPSASQIMLSQVWNNNGILIQNLIPAKRDSDNVVGMYDTVSQTFFTNAGTGTFIAGPEV